MKFLCCVLAVAFIGVFAVGAEAFLGLFGSAPPPMSDEDFIRLCRQGSAEEVRAAIQGGANANARDDSFLVITALTEAAWHNSDPEVITALIEGGADVDTTVPGVVGDDRNNTALHLAARRRNYPEFVAALINGGANIDALAYEGSTPLIIAAGIGNLDAVELLLAAGANVDAVNREGYTALMLAARRCPETTIALINGGADVNITRQARVFTAPGSNEPRTRSQRALDIARPRLSPLRDTEALRMLEELTQN